MLDFSILVCYYEYDINGNNKIIQR